MTTTSIADMKKNRWVGAVVAIVTLLITLQRPALGALGSGAVAGRLVRTKYGALRGITLQGSAAQPSTPGTDSMRLFPHTHVCAYVLYKYICFIWNGAVNMTAAAVSALTANWRSPFLFNNQRPIFALLLIIL